jgi:hypothetical protein
MSPSAAVSAKATDTIPEVFGIPLTLVAALFVAVGGASFILRNALRR